MSSPPFLNRFNYANRMGELDRMRSLAGEWCAEGLEFEGFMAHFGLTDDPAAQRLLLNQELARRPGHPLLLALAARLAWLGGDQKTGAEGYRAAAAAQAARVADPSASEREALSRIHWLGDEARAAALRAVLPVDPFPRLCGADGVANIYFHVPFTGGSSMEKAWQVTVEPDRFYTITAGLGPRDIRNFAGYSEERRRRFTYVHLHFGFPLHHVVPQPHRYSTIVRDPVEITISGYFKTKNNTTGQMLIPDDIRDGASLREHAENIVANNLTNRFARGLRMLTLTKGLEHIEEYRSWLHDDIGDDDLFDLARGVLDGFDFVGLMEHYRESVLLQMIQSGSDIPPPPPHEGPSGRPPFEAIPHDIREFIRETNNVDVRLYEYARDRFMQRYQGTLPLVRELLA